LVALQVRRVAWESWPTLGKEEEEEVEIEEERMRRSWRRTM
jgi:hypothetical protein